MECESADFTGLKIHAHAHVHVHVRNSNGTPDDESCDVLCVRAGGERICERAAAELRSPASAQGQGVSERQRERGLSVRRAGVPSAGTEDVVRPGVVGRCGVKKKIRENGRARECGDHVVSTLESVPSPVRGENVD